MKMFGPLHMVRGLDDAQIEALGDPVRARTAGLPTLEDAVEAGGWLCGPADLVTEKLMRLQERCQGLEQVNAGSVIGTPQSVIIEQLQRFAEDVMPHFKTGTAAEAGAADHAGAPA